MTKRWKVVLTYRTENGPVAVEHAVEEIEEVQDLVERGPILPLLSAASSPTR